MNYDANQTREFLTRINTEAETIWRTIDAGIFDTDEMTFVMGTSMVGLSADLLHKILREYYPEVPDDRLQKMGCIFIRKRLDENWHMLPPHASENPWSATEVVFIYDGYAVDPQLDRVHVDTFDEEEQPGMFDILKEAFYQDSYRPTVPVYMVTDDGRRAEAMALEFARQIMAEEQPHEAGLDDGEPLAMEETGI